MEDSEYRNIEGSEYDGIEDSELDNMEDMEQQDVDGCEGEDIEDSEGVNFEDWEGPDMDTKGSQSNSVDLNPLYTIAKIQGRGKGLTALQDIEAGTRILAERYIFCSDSLLKYLPIDHDESARETELEVRIGVELKKFPVDAQLEFSSFPNTFKEMPFTGRLRTNGIVLSPYTAFSRPTNGFFGMFKDLSRINHSCDPNAQQAWNSVLRCETLHALRPIAEGEEITINYYPGSQGGNHLKSIYGFDCQCGCSEEHEDKRKALRHEMLVNLVRAQGRSLVLPEQLKYAKNALDTAAELGVTGMALGDIYQIALELVAREGDAERVMKLAREAYPIYAMCQGEDGDDAMLMMQMAANPEIHIEWVDYEEDFDLSHGSMLRVGEAEEDEWEGAVEEWLWMEYYWEYE